MNMAAMLRQTAFLSASHFAVRAAGFAMRIWLSRELCDRTLADIGKHFGGRSHATVMHSISVVDEAKREDKTFYDRLMQIRESITGNV